MRHFIESEFFCGCGCGLGFDDMDDELVDDLDMARGHALVPFILTSSIRCMKHNISKHVGGLKTSSHPKGLAVDIECQSSYDRYRIIQGLKKAGFTRIGIGKNFVHADKDTDKPKELIWVY